MTLFNFFEFFTLLNGCIRLSSINDHVLLVRGTLRGQPDGGMVGWMTNRKCFWLNKLEGAIQAFLELTISRIRLEERTRVDFRGRVISNQ